MNHKHRERRRTTAQVEMHAGPVSIFIREERKKLGYTQEDFAKRIGVGLRFIKELELGKKTVRMDKVNLVLNYLGAELGPIALTPTSL